MGCDVMSVRLWLPRIRVLGVLVDAPERPGGGVCSTVRRPECPRCGALCMWVRDRRDKKVRDLEASGRPVVLVWSRRRMVCEDCERRFLEDHQAFEGSVTARLARRIVADAQVMTLASAARRHQVGWHMVNALVGAWAALVGERRRAERCRVLWSMRPRSASGIGM